MKRFKLYIEKWLNGEQVKGVRVSLYDIRCLVDVYNDIVQQKKPEFINEKVKEVLDKCGIATSEHGIGWKVV